jgi:hypothetical protein
MSTIVQRVLIELRVFAVILGNSEYISVIALTGLPELSGVKMLYSKDCTVFWNKEGWERA